MLAKLKTSRGGYTVPRNKILYSDAYFTCKYY